MNCVTYRDGLANKKLDDLRGKIGGIFGGIPRTLQGRDCGTDRKRGTRSTYPPFPLSWGIKPLPVCKLINSQRLDTKNEARQKKEHLQECSRQLRNPRTHN